MRNGCSDRLTRAGQNSLTPEQVFNLYEGQISEELEPCDDPEIDRQMEISAEELTSAVTSARALYQQHGDEGITLMLLDDNANVRSIGEALASGWYGDLAI